MPKENKASRDEMDRRLQRMEDLLTSNVPSSTAERILAAEWNVSRRQVQNIKAKLQARWTEERIQDAPHRHELLVRRIERFRGKCIVENKHAVAAQMFILEARLTAPSMQQEPDRTRILKECGRRPKDPAQALVWARKVLSVQLEEVIANPAIDFVVRQRIISDISFKLCATGTRTEVEAAIMRLEANLRGQKELAGPVKVVDAKSISRPATARGGRGGLGPRPVPGPGSRPRKGKKPGNDPDGGGPLGSP